MTLVKAVWTPVGRKGFLQAQPCCQAYVRRVPASRRPLEVVREGRRHSQQRLGVYCPNRDRSVNPQSTACAASLRHFASNENLAPGRADAFEAFSGTVGLAQPTPSAEDRFSCAYRPFIGPTSKGSKGSRAVGRRPKSNRLRRAEKGLPRRRPVGPLPALYRTSLCTRGSPRYERRSRNQTLRRGRLQTTSSPP